MRIGFCTNCYNDYRLVPMREFVGRLEPGMEVRVYSVCETCYKKLNSTIAQRVFQEDREYVLIGIRNNILKTEKEKQTDSFLLMQNKLVAWGKTIEDLT